MVSPVLLKAAAREEAEQREDEQNNQDDPENAHRLSFLGERPKAPRSAWPANAEDTWVTRRATLLPADREPARHEPATTPLVDDVDGVVLAVGACDAQEEAEPAPRTELPLARQRPCEDKRSGLDAVVLSGLLRHSVEEDLEGRREPARQLHAGALRHATRASK